MYAQFTFCVEGDKHWQITFKCEKSKKLLKEPFLNMLWPIFGVFCKHESLSAIWYHFCSLKYEKNTHGGVFTPWVFFFRFSNCTNDMKSRKASHIVLEFLEGLLKTWRLLVNLAIRSCKLEPYFGYYETSMMELFCKDD